MKHFIKTYFLLALLLLPFLKTQAQDCDCADSFQITKDTYEKNYSLFQYKVTDENRDLYTAHSDIMLDRAKQAKDLTECITILEKWLEFFRDGHTYIIRSENESVETHNENIPITMEEFKSNYAKSASNDNPILGIWKNAGYEVAIIPNPINNSRERDYVGVILGSTNPNWKKGDVKFELMNIFGTSYDINYLMGDHTIKQITGEQTDHGVLEIKTLSNWTKLWPKVENVKKPSEIERKFDQFHLSYVDNIPYLRLPDFYSVDPEYVDSIMQANHDRIIASEMMIVDVRDNSGGSDATYFPLLPYVLDGPVEMPSNGFWLSDDNTEYLINAMAASKGYSVEEYKQKDKQEYESFINNKGKAYFKGEGTWTFTADTIYKGPKKIIILTDEGVGSSGETFVYRANQSDRVVVYGQNTAGVVDGFNGFPLDLGCLTAVFPTSYRAPDIATNPIDPYGIAPDVYVDKEEDVLSYAIEHMKQLIKNEGTD
ncbi:S41 family peptidase [Nonlabens sp. YIK11]|uniref:S41 family peptidase n=1 Tax=Nonlabens sp. YIK11 TaxID=1453349 RepID=UPI0006DC6295|nr:S41 family peptidase [Nonlabens sp. YIK11]